MVSQVLVNRHYYLLYLLLSQKLLIIISQHLFRILGMVETEDHRSFALADLPGLIEGAHEGIGLGHQFLRHIERTRVIIHVIDMSGLEGRDPYEDFLTINEELEQYNLRLTERPQIIVANKMDMPEAEENLKAFKEEVG